MKTKRFDTINVVPFIDIILVLLVIVLTTATFVARGIIPVDLSETSSSKKIKNQKQLTITIKKDGQIYFDKNIVLYKNILEKLKKYKTTTPISINCDKNSKFDYFVKVIAILKKEGYTNLGIITKYE